MPLTTKQQLLLIILTFEGIYPHLNNRPTLSDLQAALRFDFSKHCTTRQIRRLLAQLERQGILYREINAWHFGRYGNQAQASRYVILDLELALDEIGA